MANKKLIQVEEWKHSEIFKRRCPAHFCPSRPRFANRPHILGRGGRFHLTLGQSVDFD